MLCEIRDVTDLNPSLIYANEEESYRVRF